MAAFSSKKISNPPNLGEQLRSCRQNLGISLADACKATNISVKYLQALESGNHQQLPGEVYAKSFLKVYANFLGLDYQNFLKIYSTEQKIYTKTSKSSGHDFRKPVERVSRAHLIVTPKIVRAGILGLLVLVCLVYLGVKVKAIMTPPILIIERPQNNLVTDQNFVEVAGSSEKEVTLEINGQQILADSSGHFSETIDLQPGVNIIEILAEKRHGPQTKVYRQVNVQPVNGQNNNN